MFERSDPWYLQQELDKYKARCGVLEDENEELREKIKSLTFGGADQDLMFKLKVSFTLTGAEAIVLAQGMKRDLVRKESVMQALYSDRVDKIPMPKIVDVFLCKLRAKLKKFDVYLSTQWGVGFSIDAINKARINEIIGNLASTID